MGHSPAESRFKEVFALGNFLDLFHSFIDNFKRLLLGLEIINKNQAVHQTTSYWALWSLQASVHPLNPH